MEVIVVLSSTSFLKFSRAKKYFLIIYTKIFFQETHITMSIPSNTSLY